ncbi:MAG: RNA polymerase sigma factor [Longimicrobiales bacterium]
MRRALEGDQDAYRELYDGNVDRVFRLGYRMLGDEEAAKEATQKSFIRAFQSLGQFRGDSAFSTWLHRVAVSVMLNERRVTARQNAREAEFDDVLMAGRPRLEPDVGVRIQRAVDGLGEIYRTVFLMHDVEGFKHEEIAEALGVAVGTCKARLSRARAQLRQVLDVDPRKAI